MEVDKDNMNNSGSFCCGFTKRLLQQKLERGGSEAGCEGSVLQCGEAVFQPVPFYPSNTTLASISPTR